MLTMVSCLAFREFIPLVSVRVRRNSYSAHPLVFSLIIDSYNSLANHMYIKRLFSVDIFTFYNSYISQWVALEIANNIFLREIIPPEMFVITGKKKISTFF